MRAVAGIGGCSAQTLTGMLAICFGVLVLLLALVFRTEEGRFLRGRLGYLICG